MYISVLLIGHCKYHILTVYIVLLTTQMLGIPSEKQQKIQSKLKL